MKARNFFLNKFVAIVLLSFGVNSCEKNETASTASLSQPPRIVKDGLRYPWEIIWGPDNRIWMTERGGKILRIDPGAGTTEMSFMITDVLEQGEGGLLGMALHPAFNNNGFLYVVYNYMGETGYKEKLVRYTYRNNTLNNPLIILDRLNAAGKHNGSRLFITNESIPKIFMTTGDAADQSSPQRKEHLNGKILRMNIDGTVPSDNPVPGSLVWSYGHRNPQGLVIANGLVYSSEHGGAVEDEINVIEKARNYGWPAIEGPCDDANEQRYCSDLDAKGPLWSSGRGTIAPSGLDYYNHDLIPTWKHSLLMVTLKNNTFHQLKLSEQGDKVTKETIYLKGQFGRLRDICVSPQGKVYICTSNGNNDRLIEING